jgi:hypothetical protein
MFVPIAVPEYRDRLEEMTAEALQEYYAHSAGHKRLFEIAAIYERHADLSTLEQARALADDGAPAELRRFAAEAYVGNGVKHLSEDIANTEAELTVEFDGEAVPYREVRPRIMNEPDGSRRRDLHARRCAATEEHLNPMYEEAVELERELTADLGAATVIELYEGFAYDPRALERETSQYLAATEGLYLERIDAALRERVGVALEDAAIPDFSRLWRAPEFDAGFATERAVPALRATLAGLGIDLDSQRNVELDIEARPGKRPRAFCAPIRVPGRVVLVILPQGGQDDYQALFHEAGHTEHFANADPGLPAEQRLLGDNAVTEGFAFLFEHLLSDPAWLHSQLDFGPVDDYIRFTALQKLFFVRRYAGKLAYEVELHSGLAVDTLPDRYTGHLSAAVGVPCPRTDYLEDVDGGFYCTCYLRAWAFEAQLRDHLRSRFGTDWFRRKAAGDLLRELWSLGQSLRADELLRELTGEPIRFEILADEARAQLA